MKALWCSFSHALYLWAWSLTLANAKLDSPTNGIWENSGTANKLTYLSSSGTTGTYTLHYEYCKIILR